MHLFYTINCHSITIGYNYELNVQLQWVNRKKEE